MSKSVLEVLLFNLASSILDLSSMLVAPSPLIQCTCQSGPHWGGFVSGTGTGMYGGWPNDSVQLLLHVVLTAMT